jgi:hypothetical protein
LTLSFGPHSGSPPPFPNHPHPVCPASSLYVQARWCGPSWAATLGGLPSCSTPPGTSPSPQTPTHPAPPASPSGQHLLLLSPAASAGAAAVLDVAAPRSPHAAPQPLIARCLLACLNAESRRGRASGDGGKRDGLQALGAAAGS